MGKIDTQTARSLAIASVVPVAIYLIYALTFFYRFGYPLPAVHDEFSYLLAADTFAHFRLANPTPPMWESFESIHINMIPTYGSMYLPGQGLFLAAGQVVFGHPWWGVVLSAALFILATGWAALAWLPMWWALAANMTALTFVVGSYWTSSYWGGCVAALGGALILGAVGYCRAKPTVSLGALWALGCVLLIFTRPFGGTVLILLSLLELVRIWWSDEGLHSGFLRWLSGSVPIALVGIAFLMFYNYRTTGHPTRLAFQENARQYQIRRLFYWANDREEPTYRHEQIRKVYHELLRANWTKGKIYGSIILMMIRQYGGLRILPIGILLAFFGWRSGGYRFVLITLVGGVLALSMLLWINPHYYAPFAAFIPVAFVLGAKFTISRFKTNSIMSRALLILLPLLVFSKLCTLAIANYTPLGWTKARSEIAAALEGTREKHLVLVKYSERHSIYDEWVYNEADFEDAPVLWARWWNDKRKNSELARAFGSRRVWVVEPDLPGEELKPFDASIREESNDTSQGPVMEKIR